MTIVRDRAESSATQAVILLIDDDTLIRTLVVKGLSRAGMTVHQAGNGDDGLAQLEDSTPDLVLLDVHMPGIGGFDTLRAIRHRAASAELPVIMLTADDDASAIETAFELGATDFITKPINLRLLEQRIRFAMASHAREQHLREVQAERSSACRIARLGFWRMDPTTLEFDWSGSAAELLGSDNRLPESLAELANQAHRDDALRFRSAFDSAAESGRGFDLEARIFPGPNERLIRFSSAGTDEYQMLSGSFQDVTKLRQLEHQISFLAEHDELTGLPKQRLFTKLVDGLLQEQSSAKCLVLAISIQPVLKLSEHFGARATQDSILAVLNRLQANPSESLLLGQLDDNLFGLAVSARHGETVPFAQNIAEAISQPIIIGGREIAATPVVGAAVFPDHAKRAEGLIKAARLACRSALDQRSQSPSFYSEQAERDYGSRLMLEADLRTAIREDQFFLVFQPQIALHSGKVVGGEALLRWHHPERGVISPAEFIPVLEDTGLIAEAGAWVLEQAVQAAARLRASGHDLRMGVNLSAVQLRDQTLPHTLTAICARHGLQPRHMELEVTEGAAMHDPTATRILLEQLKSDDFQLSIDDFGTGHSALSYITEFPMDTIKIDRCFVREITEGRKQRAIVTAISALSSQLGLNTIAEGIETERQKDYVDALGVHEIQGFLISRPLPYDEFEKFLCTYKRR